MARIAAKSYAERAPAVMLVMMMSRMTMLAGRVIGGNPQVLETTVVVDRFIVGIDVFLTDGASSQDTGMILTTGFGAGNSKGSEEEKKS